MEALDAACVEAIVGRLGTRDKARFGAASKRLGSVAREDVEREIVRLPPAMEEALSAAMSGCVEADQACRRWLERDDAALADGVLSGVAELHWDRDTVTVDIGPVIEPVEPVWVPRSVEALFERRGLRCISRCGERGLDGRWRGWLQVQALESSRHLAPVVRAAVDAVAAEERECLGYAAKRRRALELVAAADAHFRSAETLASVRRMKWWSRYPIPGTEEACRHTLLLAAGMCSLALPRGMTIVAFGGGLELVTANH
jgi:hypothetical protein